MRLGALVNKHYKQLNANDILVWQYICQHKNECLHLSIEALAKKCNLSRSTVMRFAQKLGMTGYSELKACIRWETEEVLDLTEPLTDIICKSNIETIRYFKEQNYEKICSLLFHAKRIFAYGTGNIQKAVCSEFQRMMLSLKIVVTVIPGEGEFRHFVQIMNKDDVLLIVSKSGESIFIQDIMTILDGKEIPVISLTRYGNNTLSQRSTYNLFINIEQVTLLDDINFESMTMMFLVVEILFAKFAEYYNTHIHSD